MRLKEPLEGTVVTVGEGGNDYFNGFMLICSSYLWDSVGPYDKMPTK